MTRYKLAIFDLAGTTIKDSNTVGQCLQEALYTVGVEAKVADVNAVMGIRKPIAIAQLLEKYGVAGDIDAIHEDFRRRMIATYRTSVDAAEIPGTTEVFRALKNAGIKVAVDTGFDRETTDILLGRVDWGDLLEDSITSDEVENGRPHADMALELCRRAGVVPGEAIKVGDTPADLGEGNAAGVGLNVGVTYGTHTADELRAHKPDVLIGEIGELLRYAL